MLSIGHWSVEATGRPYWHSPVGAILHRNERNYTVFKYFVDVVGTVTLVLSKNIYFKEYIIIIYA
jgi:hypothetical protein